MTVADMTREIARVRAGDAASQERMFHFHRHENVRHLVIAAETYMMNTNREDARTLAEWHVRVLGYVRLRTADDEQTWRDTPYITGVLRRYADRV